MIGGKSIGKALHPAVFAVLLQGIACCIVHGILAGVAVGGKALAGVAVDPCTGKAFHQLCHIGRIFTRGIKVEMPLTDGVSPQIMLHFVGGLQRSRGKHEHQPAQKHAGRAPPRKGFQAFYRRSRGHGQQRQRTQ